MGLLAQRAFCWALTAVSMIAPAVAAAAPRFSSAPEVSTAIAESVALRKAGQAATAVELLKRLRPSHPGSEPLTLALALAYFEDSNVFWALGVLDEYTREFPPACDSRAFAAWLHWQQANLEMAEELLRAPECTRQPEQHARVLLLRALIAEQRQQRARVISLLEQARALGVHYAEDRELLDTMAARYLPERAPWLSFSLELAGGYSSQPLAAAPIDEQSQRQTGSAVGLLGLRLRSVITTGSAIAPVVDGRINAQQLTRSTASGYSYRQLALRPGLVLGKARPRLELRYAAEAVHLQEGIRYTTSPIWYSEAHRAEFEVDATDRFVAFGGFGRRTFRERVRTRWELDQGLAWALPVRQHVDLLLGGSARWYSARQSAHTQLGATALAQLDVRVLTDLGLRETVAISGDTFPHSEGYFPSAEGAARREALLRASMGLWWPATSALRGALEYTYAWRESTASAYDYGDHRVLLRLLWASDSDRLGSTQVSRDGRVPLETGRKGGGGQDRGQAIRELMRQDESVRRGSSCMK